MHNPAYLTQSRHNVFYCRFPMRTGGAGRMGALAAGSHVERVNRHAVIPCEGTNETVRSTNYSKRGQGPLSGPR